MRRAVGDGIFARHWVRIAMAIILVVLSAHFAAATPVTYTQVIEDLDHPLGGLDISDTSRNLRRTTTLGNGSTTVEDTDSTLVAENPLSSNLGFSTNDPISWLHTFTFLPPVVPFLEGSLTLDVAGVNPGPLGNGNDGVRVEGFLVGSLVPGGMGNESVTTLSCSMFPGCAAVLDATIKTLLVDNRLTVSITPTFGSGLFADFMSIRSSRVDATYEPIPVTSEVPEPGTVVLLGSGLALLVSERGRKKEIRRAGARAIARFSMRRAPQRTS